jgi:hypothetical protein
MTFPTSALLNHDIVDEVLSYFRVDANENPRAIVTSIPNRTIRSATSSESQTRLSGSPKSHGLARHGSSQRYGIFIAL